MAEDPEDIETSAVLAAFTTELSDEAIAKIEAAITAKQQELAEGARVNSGE